ncbi:MAG TPA: FKBP-type peptidyl-prolyl cis-trans isomerase [Candidatus Paceibacterota bacterium]|nr:FKBP-type peptidyl-prolyl cis-trans isomerase [Candidatus Paceibacterota bacterium]
MKAIIRWGSAAVVLVAIAVGVVVHYHHTKPQLPPPDTAALAGPQTALPTTSYPPTTPLPKQQTMNKDTMKIEVVTNGTGPTIHNGQTAVVNYIGKLQNGTVFDASANHGDGTFSFVVGAGQVIKGWDEGVLGMTVGEHRVLTIPPELAYGSNGVPPVIPPNATLVFDVTLLGIK